MIGTLGSRPVHQASPGARELQDETGIVGPGWSAWERESLSRWSRLRVPPELRTDAGYLPALM